MVFFVPHPTSLLAVSNQKKTRPDAPMQYRAALSIAPIYKRRKTNLRKLTNEKNIQKLTSEKKPKPIARTTLLPSSRTPDYARLTALVRGRPPSLRCRPHTSRSAWGDVADPFRTHRRSHSGWRRWSPSRASCQSPDPPLNPLRSRPWSGDDPLQEPWAGADPQTARYYLNTAYTYIIQPSYVQISTLWQRDIC